MSGTTRPLAMPDPWLVPRNATATTTAAVATATATRAAINRVGRRSAVMAWDSAADGQGAVHRLRMDRALVLVGAGSEGRDRIVLRGHAREVLVVDDLLARAVEDV